MRGSAALLLAAAGAAAAAPPAPALAGPYAGELCGATRPPAAPTCGPAEVDVDGPLVSVRVADIVYRLVLRPEQADVQTLHGKMEIDEFSAVYDWQGETLRFNDPDKDVHYEVRIGLRKGAAPHKGPGART